MHENNSCFVELKTLGSFDLKVNGQSLVSALGHSFKLRSILCYLILARGRSVSRAELVDTFYEDEKQSNPEGALKMQIMRIKKALAPLVGECNPIISQRGSYRWNPDITCSVDTELFENLCNSGNDIRRLDQERIEDYKQAVELYEGDCVLDNDGLIWSKTLASVLHTRFLGSIGRYVALLKDAEEYAEIEDTCFKAIKLDPYSEDMYIMLIQSLIEQEKYSEARNQYKVIADVLFKELGIHPSAALQELYVQSCTEKKPWEQDLSLVLEDMRDSSEKQGAFFCGYEQFKSIYQLEVRRALRNGTCLHVAMLTVTGNVNKKLDYNVSSAVMDKVQQTVLTHLRQSDVVSRYSNQQLIIMLPNANQEDSYQVMERVIRAHKANNPVQAIKLTYQIRELELAL